MSEQLNKQSMNLICDNIIKILQLCNQYVDLWKNDKYEMLRKIKEHYEDFYELYPRICRILVFSDDITPLLGMINTFSKVQSGEISFQEANNSITNAINAKYVDGVLNSDTLVKEREEKIKKEKINNIE